MPVGYARSGSGDQLDIVFVVAGLAALLLGGHMLVQGAVALATHLIISPMIIGLTIVFDTISRSGADRRQRAAQRSVKLQRRLHRSAVRARHRHAAAHCRT